MRIASEAYAGPAMQGVFMPRRMSVTPPADQTFTPAGNAIIDVHHFEQDPGKALSGSTKDGHGQADGHWAEAKFSTASSGREQGDQQPRLGGRYVFRHGYRM